MADWRVPLFDTRFGPEEEAAVLRPLRARWLTMGDEVLGLEEELCRLTGAAHAIAVSNCTAALELVSAALGVGPGDEVICPALTFVATANAPRGLGADVRFCESAGPDDLTADPASVERLFTPRTKAVMAVHYAGFACDMDALLPMAASRGVAVVEDCAHALVTSYRGKALGLHGKAGCFSFFSNKNATCGEGGAVLTDDRALADRVRLLRSHGMTSLTLDRHRGRAVSYDVVLAGHNSRLDEIRAALLRAQLARLPEYLDRRRALFARYADRLANTRVHVPFASPARRAECPDTAVHIMAVLLPEGTDRGAVMARMKAAGIQTSIHYPPVHRFTAYQAGGQELPATEALAARQLTLPLYPAMTPADLDLVVDSLSAALSP